MVPRTIPSAVVDSVDATAIDEALHRVRGRKLDVSFTVTAIHDGETSLHFRLFTPGKRRPEIDLFTCAVGDLGPDDFGAEESAEILAAVETVLPQMQALRDRLDTAAARE